MLLSDHWSRRQGRKLRQTLSTTAAAAVLAVVIVAAAVAGNRIQQGAGREGMMHKVCDARWRILRLDGFGLATLWRGRSNNSSKNNTRQLVPHPRHCPPIPHRLAPRVSQNLAETAVSVDDVDSRTTRTQRRQRRPFAGLADNDAVVVGRVQGVWFVARPHLPHDERKTVHVRLVVVVGTTAALRVAAAVDDFGRHVPARPDAGHGVRAFDHASVGSTFG